MSSVYRNQALWLLHHLLLVSDFVQHLLNFHDPAVTYQSSVTEALILYLSIFILSQFILLKNFVQKLWTRANIVPLTPLHSPDSYTLQIHILKPAMCVYI